MNVTIQIRAEADSSKPKVFLKIALYVPSPCIQDIRLYM